MSMAPSSTTKTGYPHALSTFSGQRAAPVPNSCWRLVARRGALGEDLTMDFKLGSKSINPWLLFQTSGGLFWKENG